MAWPLALQTGHQGSVLEGGYQFIDQLTIASLQRWEPTCSACLVGNFQLFCHNPDLTVECNTLNRFSSSQCVSGGSVNSAFDWWAADWFSGVENPSLGVECDESWLRCKFWDWSLDDTLWFKHSVHTFRLEAVYGNSLNINPLLGMYQAGEYWEWKINTLAVGFTLLSFGISVVYNVHIQALLLKSIIEAWFGSSGSICIETDLNSADNVLGKLRLVISNK